MTKSPQAEFSRLVKLDDLAIFHHQDAIPGNTGALRQLRVTGELTIIPGDEFKVIQLRT